jgi:hypothetical protein
MMLSLEPLLFLRRLNNVVEKWRTQKDGSDEGYAYAYFDLYIRTVFRFPFPRVSIFLSAYRDGFYVFEFVTFVFLMYEAYFVIVI